jgi:mannose-6-phosphate isomerase-like protein (cupin superfamily)
MSCRRARPRHCASGTSRKCEERKRNGPTELLERRALGRSARGQADPYTDVRASARRHARRVPVRASARVPGFSLHMHYGAEEMFFFVSGTPTLRNGKTEEQLSPGDVVYCPEGIEGLHTFMNPTNEPARLLATSRAASLTSSRIRSRGTHGWRPATRNSPRRRSATRGSSRASSCRRRNDGRRWAFSYMVSSVASKGEFE